MANYKTTPTPYKAPTTYVDFMAPFQGAQYGRELVQQGREFENQQKAMALENFLNERNLDDARAAQDATAYLSTVRGNLSRAGQMGIPFSDAIQAQIQAYQNDEGFKNLNPAAQDKINRQMAGVVNQGVKRAMDSGHYDIANQLAQTIGTYLPASDRDMAVAAGNPMAFMDAMARDNPLSNISSFNSDGSLELGGVTYSPLEVQRAFSKNPSNENEFIRYANEAKENMQDRGLKQQLDEITLRNSGLTEDQTRMVLERLRERQAEEREDKDFRNEIQRYIMGGQVKNPPYNVNNLSDLDFLAGLNPAATIESVPPMAESVPPMAESVPPMAESVPPMGNTQPTLSPAMLKAALATTVRSVNPGAWKMLEQYKTVSPQSEFSPFEQLRLELLQNQLKNKVY